MRIVVEGIAFTEIDIPEDLVREFSPRGKFERVWAEKIAVAISGKIDEHTSRSLHFSVANVLEAIHKKALALEKE